eukprot:scaffold218507_cov21-Prasinocladus_malaysianus.AAC.1
MRVNPRRFFKPYWRPANHHTSQLPTCKDALAKNWQAKFRDTWWLAIAIICQENASSKKDRVHDAVLALMTYLNTCRAQSSDMPIPTLTMTWSSTCLRKCRGKNRITIPAIYKSQVAYGRF